MDATTTSATDHAVVIAGGGPTGMMLAAELAIAGVDVVIVERRATQHIDGSRSRGLHARTLEVLDQRGVVDRFLDEGQPMPAIGFAGIPLDISDFPSRNGNGLALAQSHVERILAGWVDELGVPTVRPLEVAGFAQDDDGVDIELSDGSTLRTRFLVGCDGGRSLVRKTAGIDFPGIDPSTSWILAELRMIDEPPVGVRPEGGGIGPVAPAQGGDRYGAVLKEPWDPDADEPTFDDVRAALVRTYGSDFGAHSPTLITRFTDMSRQAATYRQGRVLLAGDAAHVHPPMGGQGLNLGMQDAVNLGWKLAQVVHGTSDDALLDSYHAERHPVGARVLQNTKAQGALMSADDRHLALREIIADLAAMDESRRYLGGMMSGLDIRYDLGDGHPLVGRRMPDLDLRVADERTRVFALLHDARALLLDLGGTGDVDLSRWAGRVRHVAAEFDGTWELPVVGTLAAPAAVLIRPDGHVAWAGDDLGDGGLVAALETWFGAPAAV